MVDVGATYCATARLKFSGGYQYTWSRAAITSAPAPAVARDFDNPPPAPPSVVPNWSAIPGLSDVVVETNRITVGVDFDRLSGTRRTGGS